MKYLLIALCLLSASAKAQQIDTRGSYGDGKGHWFDRNGNLVATYGDSLYDKWATMSEDDPANWTSKRHRHYDSVAAYYCIKGMLKDKNKAIQKEGWRQWHEWGFDIHDLSAVDSAPKKVNRKGNSSLNAQSFSITRKMPSKFDSVTMGPCMMVFDDDYNYAYVGDCSKGYYHANTDLIKNWKRMNHAQREWLRKFEDTFYAHSAPMGTRPEPAKAQLLTRQYFYDRINSLERRIDSLNRWQLNNQETIWDAYVGVKDLDARLDSFRGVRNNPPERLQDTAVFFISNKKPSIWSRAGVFPCILIRVRFGGTLIGYLKKMRHGWEPIPAYYKVWE